MTIKTVLKYINYRLTAFTDHDLHSPFLFRFYSELIKNKFPFSDFEKLAKLRQQLLLNNQIIEITDFGAGSKKINNNKRVVSQITKHGIAQKKQAEFLYRLVNDINPKTIVELGASVGLTTLYLAKAAPKATVYTFEGCPNLVQFASALFIKQQQQNIQIIQGDFNNTFPDFINTHNNVDLLYIDGNHAYEPTMKYFEMALTKKTAQSVFIFDDINWSVGMQKAWKEISQHREVKLSLDFFFFGMVFFRTENKEKEHFVLKF